MISLTDKEKYIIKKYIVEHDIVYFNVKKFDFSNGTYYIKFCKEDEAFKELLGKKIFDIAGIKCPEYKYYNDLHCVVGEDLNSFGKFIYMSNFPFIVEDTTYRRISFDILVAAVCKYFSNKEDVYLQIIIMHFIDILFSNIDRHLNNYGVYIKNKLGELAVFDHGMLLDNFDCITQPQSCITDKIFFTKMIECSHFIKKIPLNYSLKLYELYLKFTPDFVGKLIEDLEKESEIEFTDKKSTLLKYYKNYLLTGLVLVKYINMSDRKEVVRVNKKKYSKI